MNSPVFIIGCPRSGTTILLRLLGMHESFAWVSQYVNHFPRRIYTSLLKRIYDVPVVGSRLRIKENRYLPMPVEPWQFWRAHLSNFCWKTGRDVRPRLHNANDITDEEIRRIRGIVQAVCRHQDRQKFLSKYTDFPRITYLLQAFPDAQFIHIIRDGRAVVNSYFDKVRTGAFATWSQRDWWESALPRPWREDFREQHYSPWSLLAYLWMFFVSLNRDEAKALPASQYMEVRYSELTRSPSTTLRRLTDYCGLEFTRKFEWCIDRKSVRSMDYKWKENLDAAQQQELACIFAEEPFRSLLDS